MNRRLLTLISLFLVCAANAQNKIDLQNLSRFTVVDRNANVVVENGRSVLKLDEAPGDGMVILNDVNFAQGTIEFDVRGRNVLQQSFVGIAFHVQDRNHYDAIYFRPFNFANADTARRRRAVQYIAAPDFPWEKLREQHPGKYENKVNPVPDPDNWFHAKVVVANNTVTVYVNRSPTPSLQITMLTSAKDGKIALWTGNGSNAAFADLTIAPK